MMCVVASSQFLSLIPLNFFRSPVTTPKLVSRSLSGSALLSLSWPTCRASFSAGSGSWPSVQRSQALAMRRITRGFGVWETERSLRTFRLKWGAIVWLYKRKTPP